MVDFLLSGSCSVIVHGLCIFGFLLSLWYLNVFGVTYTAVMGSQSSSKALCSPFSPHQRIVVWYVHTSLCFTPPLLSSLSAENWQKALFSEKRKLLECVERWSRSGLVPVRGALFSEQSYLCLPGGFKLFSVSCALRADHRQSNNAWYRCDQRLANAAAPIAANIGISCVSLSYLHVPLNVP